MKKRGSEAPDYKHCQRWRRERGYWLIVIATKIKVRDKGRKERERSGGKAPKVRWVREWGRRTVCGKRGERWVRDLGR